MYVTISIPAVGVQLHYTLDGSDPDMNSTVYTGPIAITESTTIKAIAVCPDGSCESAISTATYEFPPDVPVPVFSLPSGIYDTAQTLEISVAMPGAKIHYTTDGSEPTNASAQYTGPITVTHRGRQIRTQPRLRSSSTRAFPSRARAFDFHPVGLAVG